MNKKIFTLLAGAFLMFAMVFSVSAQGDIWKASRLNLGDAVGKLNAGMNAGYYHLRLDSIQNVGTPSDTTMVLFMSKPNVQGQLNLFVDSLNNAGETDDRFATDSKAERSAASLWCVNIADFEQGQNITFDFVNKQREEMLQVDIFGYETWAKPADEASHSGPTENIVPGGISGWEFSETYATMLETVSPLISYITPDTVAVLCVSADSSIYVKIADATDVQEGLVDSVALFTLVNAAPFIVDAVDYNTMFGTKPSTSTFGNLSFSPDVDGYTNPFATGNLTAEHLDTLAGYRGIRIDTLGWSPWYGQFPTEGVANYDTTYYSATYLDSLGYMTFSNAAGQVQVLREYFDDNAGGHQFPKIEVGPAYDQQTDSMFYGQFVFRMVYYPSGDSIYINPYQATYYPEWDPEIIADFNITEAFADSASLGVFTYYADTAALQHPTGAAWGAPDSVMMIARLKNGKRTTDFYEPFTDYHKLYVSLQNLTGQTRGLTLNSSAAANHTINTHINFGIYNPCTLDADNNRTTVTPDVYLIRNTKGEYLQVPLYSANDSAVWVSLDKDEDPRYIPSFHWIVEKRYMNSAISPVTITNREFDWLEFANIQLYKEAAPFETRGQNYEWNDEDVLSEVTTWEDRNNNNFAFVKVAKEFKNNPLLGYTWIDPDTSVVNQYAFNYMSGIDDTKYIGWAGDIRDYPNTDTTLYVNYDTYFDKMYFSLDTIMEAGYGGLNEYGFDAESTNQIADLVTLERQAYRLTLKDPYMYECVHEFHMAPGEDQIYGITKKGTYKSLLGKPVFYLRDVYKVADDVPYFALVQRIDTVTLNADDESDATLLETYLETIYGEGTKLVDDVMNSVRKAGKFNPGLFAVEFDDATAKMKMVLRAETTDNGVSTFKLEKDVDPIYRRFNTVKEGEANDNPDYVHFHQRINTDQLLFENTGFYEGNQTTFWETGKKNYLGFILRTEEFFSEEKSSTTIYVDTAYVNRGTGYIKPQYMLAVRPTIVEPAMACDDLGNPTISLPGYLEAYYLINAHDSAYTATGVNSDYLWENSWTRLVFTRAIHANDHLYILGDQTLPSELYGRSSAGGALLDLNKLHAYATRPGSLVHAIYLGNNLHKDCVFSFRLIERRADDFIIESETTNRDVTGPMIKPCYGGWVKDENGVAVISRSDEVNSMLDGVHMNVYKSDVEKATANDEVETSSVTVIGNAGAVSILNAAGKKVVISNILGQTVAQTVLTSDNETIAAAKGIVIVSIEGEEAVKTLVK